MQHHRRHLDGNLIYLMYGKCVWRVGFSALVKLLEAKIASISYFETGIASFTLQVFVGEVCDDEEGSPVLHHRRHLHFGWTHYSLNSSVSER